MQNDLPAHVAGWRNNFKRLGDAIAASPLPTRQLKRMAARALSRSLSSAQKIEARKQARLNMKKRRAGIREA